MYWALGGFAAIILAGLGTVVAIVWRLNTPDGERRSPADHFPPPADQ